MRKYIQIAVAGISALFIFFSLQIFIVTGESMAPTYIHDQYVLVESVSHRFGELGRGSVVVFKHPRDAEHITMKRIIGLPNEVVKMTNSSITIIRKGGQQEVFDASTVIGGGTSGQNGSKFEIVLGPEDYFVLGDNRSKSTDSRDWGTIQPSNIIGKPLFSF